MSRAGATAVSAHHRTVAHLFQRNLHRHVEQVDHFLRSHGLADYEARFQAEGLDDMVVMRHMSTTELAQVVERVGFKFGHGVKFTQCMDKMKVTPPPVAVATVEAEGITVDETRLDVPKWSVCLHGLKCFFYTAIALWIIALVLAVALTSDLTVHDGPVLIYNKATHTREWSNAFQFQGHNFYRICMEVSALQQRIPRGAQPCLCALTLHALCRSTPALSSRCWSHSWSHSS